MGHDDFLQVVLHCCFVCISYRGIETSGCYVAELDQKVVGMVAYEKKVLRILLTFHRILALYSHVCLYVCVQA